MASPKTTTLIKDPDARLNYTLNWSKWLDSGDTISSASWIHDTALTAVSNSNTTTTATIILEGGKLAKKYRVTCRIATANGLIDDRSFFLQIRER